MGKPVKVRITSEVVGKHYVTTYLRGAADEIHRRRYFKRPDPLNNFPPGERYLAAIYEVPTYRVVVEGGRSFSAVRFGVRTPVTYSLESWPDVSPPGAGMEPSGGIYRNVKHDPYDGGSWRIHGPYLIHPGNRSPKTVAGDLGCIEIVEEWTSFVGALVKATGDQHVKPQQIILDVEMTKLSYPKAKLAVPVSAIIHYLPSLPAVALSPQEEPQSSQRPQPVRPPHPAQPRSHRNIHH